MNFAFRSRRARRISGLSQARLAAMIGVGRTAVANWEGAAGFLPSTGHLLAHARATGVAFEWLATGRGPMRLAHDPGDDVPAVAGVLLVECPRERAFLMDFRVASANAQSFALEVVRESAHRRGGRRRPDR